jgi:putative peptidoglycan lipid II flippase
MTTTANSLQPKNHSAHDEVPPLTSSAGVAAPAGSGALRNSLIYGSASFAAYSLSMLKAIVVARWFGTSPEMDAFTLAILVPNLAGSLLTSTAAGALVPVLLKASSQSDDTRATVFRSALTLFTLVCLALTLMLAIFASPICHVLAAKFDPYRLELTIKMMRWASGLVFSTGVYAFCSAELLSRKKFWLVGAAPAVSTALSLLAILFWHRLGVGVLIWSLEAGVAVQALILVVPAWRAAAGGRTSAWRNSSVWQCLTSQGALLGAASIGVGNVFIDQMLSARMPAGNASALNYAGSLNTGMMQIVVMALSWVALPELAALVASRRLEALRSRMRYCLLLATVIAAPASAAVIAFGYNAVQIVFEHGLFTSKSTESVSLAWLGYSLGLVPAAAGMIVVRLVNAMGQNSLLLQIGLLLLAANAALDYWLMQVWGLIGISLSTTLVYCVSASVLLLVMQKRLGGILDRKTSRRILLAAAGAFLSIVPPVLLRLVFGSSPLAMIFQLAVFSAAVLTAYSVTNLVRWTCPRPCSLMSISLRLALEETP